ncbi:MAG: CinA family protein [Anaerosacchariphilus sp.]
MGEQQKMTLAEEVVELLEKDELTVTTAESCTGGLVAARLVDVPGVSEVFKQGFITYSNKAKRKLLNVKKTTLKEFGAVSEKTAREMAKGAILASGADAAIATTGIAGPDGGTEEKPVGLVYIGVSVRGQMYVEEYHFEGERSEVRESTVQAALALLKKGLEETDGNDQDHQN